MIYIDKSAFDEKGDYPYKANNLPFSEEKNYYSRILIYQIRILFHLRNITENLSNHLFFSIIFIISLFFIQFHTIPLLQINYTYQVHSIIYLANYNIPSPY